MYPFLVTISKMNLGDGLLGPFVITALALFLVLSFFLGSKKSTTTRDEDKQKQAQVQTPAKKKNPISEAIELSRSEEKRRQAEAASRIRGGRRSNEGYSTY